MDRAEVDIPGTEPRDVVPAGAAGALHQRRPHGGGEGRPVGGPVEDHSVATTAHPLEARDEVCVGGAPERAQQLEATPNWMAAAGTSGSRAIAARSLSSRQSSIPAHPGRPRPGGHPDPGHPVAEHRPARQRERTSARVADRGELVDAQCVGDQTRVASDRRQAEREVTTRRSRDGRTRPAGCPARGQGVGEHRLQPGRRGAVEVDEWRAVEVAGLAHHQRVVPDLDQMFAQGIQHALEGTPGQPGEQRGRSQWGRASAASDASAASAPRDRLGGHDGPAEPASAASSRRGPG